MTRHWIDAAVLAAYLVLTFIFGIFASRMLGSRIKKGEEHKEENYFLAGRRMPAWLNGISFAVTAMNGNVAPTYCGLAVVTGLSICWFYISNTGLCLLIAGMLFAVRWRQIRISTGPEFFTFRFGGRGAKFIRVYSSLSATLLTIIPYIGVGMLGIHMVFGPIFGIENRAITLAIILPVLLIYVWISGFAGVLITDLLQTIIIVLSSIVLLISVLVRFNGPAGIASAITQVHGQAASDILSILPVPGHRAFGPMMAISFFIVFTLGAGGNMGLEAQRIFSCRSPKEAGKVSVWTETVLFLMLLLLTLPAIGALIEHPEMYMAGPKQREEIYGMMLKDHLPVGLLGLALAALIASVMSTIDSHLNYGAQTLVNDVYRPLVGHISDKNAVWLGRVFMLLMLIAAVIVVYFATSLLGIIIVMAGLFGSTALLGWGQWWWWRVNIKSWIVAMVSGPTVYLSLGFALKHTTWWREHINMGQSMSQQLAMLQAVIGMAITTTIWVLVALLTKPQDIKTLKEFYRRARPSGFWGPVRTAVELEDGPDAPKPTKYLIPAGFLTAILGTVWIAMAVLSISLFFVAQWSAGVATAITAIVGAYIFKRLFNWHIGRMADD